MDGFLLIDKPVGWTSFDVVAKVRGILRTEIRNQQLENSKNKLVTNSQLLITPSAKPKVGHTGTLDPAASGLMIIVVGGYCKRASEFSKLDKTYEAELTLGSTSTTDDREGEITPKSTHQPTESDVKSTMNRFTGQITQIPPIYSAIKVDGQRAYKLARAGKEVKMESRPAIIHSISDVEYEYPKLKFTVQVSSGTYIRSLAKDIGIELGVGAYLSALRRTKVGKFDIKDSLELESADADTLTSSLLKYF